MSKRRCYITNCTSRGADEEKSISMFTVPNDDEAYALWKSVIPPGNRELKKYSHICEHHFEKNCINWTSHVKLTDGSTVEVLLKKPRLKRGSIPTIFDSSLYEESGRKSPGDEDELSVSSDSTSPAALSKSKYTGYVCSVSSCKYSIRRNVGPNIPVSFHKYPKDPALQEVWIKRCRPPSSQVASVGHRRVCSLHFEKRFIKIARNKKKCLAKNCAPTLNLPADEGRIEEEDQHDEPDPLAEPSIEMIQDIPSSTLRDNTTAEEMSDEDILVIDETPDLESSGSTETLIDPPPRPPTPPDPLVQVNNVPKRGRPSIPVKSKSAPQRLNSLTNSLHDVSSDDHPSSSRDNISKFFENIDFDPFSLEKFDLQDPLELACDDAIWNRLNFKAQKALLRAYFKRISYLLPDEYKRSNTTEILCSALEYLQWVGKKNSSLALMNEMLSQKHYALRTKHERLTKIFKKSNASSNNVTN